MAALDVRIRAAEPADADAVRRIYAAPAAQAGTLQLPYPTLDLWQQRLAGLGAGRHALVAEVDGEVVGQIGLYTQADTPRRAHVAGIGMGVRDDWQGRGIGGALLAAAIDLAERWLQVTRIEIEVYADNAAAIALYKKHGFVREGLHRRHAFRDGAYVDTLSMARLRPTQP
ncbi:MAG: GNAT family N-acetyltransferase [Xanthomonadaceae bacterium]|jgi:putative acetyltransferase|nr:GNAT family N-acetyltransferase [Xanthomonadaceae bacterium]